MTDADFKQQNTYYETQSGFAIDAGDAVNNSGIDEMTPEDQLYVSFIGNWLGLSKKGITGIQPAPYSDKKSIGLKYINNQAIIHLPWVLNGENEISLADLLEIGYEEYIDPLNKENNITRSMVLDANKRSVENLLQIDYYYRRNQKIHLLNKLISDWCIIAEELGESLDIDGSILQPYTEQELTDIYSDVTKFNVIPDAVITKMNQLETLINNIKGKKVEGNPNYQRDLQDRISRIASKHGISIVDELHCSQNKLTKKWGLNQTLVYDILNLKDLKTFRAYFNELFEDFFNSAEVESLKSLIKRNFSNKEFDKFKDYQTIGGTKKVILNDRFKLELMKYVAYTNIIQHQYTDLVSKEEYLDPAKFKFVEPTNNHGVTTVISGGQTGVDLIGL